jgi:hypothetical protein
VNDAHEVDIHHSPKQRRIGFAERQGFSDAGIGNQNINRLTACGFRNRSADGGLICDIGYACEVRAAGGNGVIEGRTIAAEHRHRRSSLRERGRNLAADATSTAGDQRMRRTRQSRHRASSGESVNTQDLRIF